MKNAKRKLITNPGQSQREWIRRNQGAALNSISSRLTLATTIHDGWQMLVAVDDLLERMITEEFPQLPQF